MIRVIVTLPTDGAVHEAPAQGMFYVSSSHGAVVDFITDGTGTLPPETIYACQMNADGTFTTLMPCPTLKVKQNFAGWPAPDAPPPAVQGPV